ncbi:hypothetical protein Tco_1308161, partial [Tanacetum coccineum]
MFLTHGSLPWNKGEQQSRGAGRRKTKALMLIGKFKKLWKQRAIVHMGVVKLCKTHNVKTLFKLIDAYQKMQAITKAKSNSAHGSGKA